LAKIKKKLEKISKFSLLGFDFFAKLCNTVYVDRKTVAPVLFDKVKMGTNGKTGKILMIDFYRGTRDDFFLFFEKKEEDRQDPDDKNNRNDKWMKTFCSFSNSFAVH